jgi:hypothetical protein
MSEEHEPKPAIEQLRRRFDSLCDNNEHVRKYRARFRRIFPVKPVIQHRDPEIFNR